MPDRRQVLRAALLGAAGLAVPAGLAGLASCGVPGGGRAIVDEPGPSAGIGGLASGGRPLGPESATTPEQLVQYYLLAAAGLLEDEHRSTLQEQAKKYMTESHAATVTLERDITVVRVAREPTHREGSAGPIVTIGLQQVGQLTTFAAVTPQTPPVPAVDVDFYLVPGPAGAGYRIDAIKCQQGTVPSALLLSSQALVDPALFMPQLLYFWPNADDDFLVPDVRYIPVFGGPQIQYTKIVNCLLGGPPTWLDASQVLPASMKLLGPNVVPSDRLLKINVSNAPSDPARFMTQLRWSLFSLYQEPVQLQVNSQPHSVDGSGTAFLQHNMADVSRTRSGSEDAFCVAGGVVRPLRPDTLVPQVLQSGANNGVVSAALSRDKRQAAVVRDAGGGRYGLWLGTADSHAQYLRVAGLPPGLPGRPAWLPGQSRLLVIAGNRLYAVDAGTAAATEITPSGISQVSAFSVAPDGRRIAMVVDGDPATPAVAALTVTTQTTVVGTPQRFGVPWFTPGSLSAIAWSRLDRVVIAGRASTSPGAYGLVEMTIDGAYAQELDVNLAGRITHLVAYPPAPSAQTMNTSMGKVFGQADTGGKTYAFEYNGQYHRLDDLQIPPSPAPSGATPRPPQSLAPMVPFFAD